MNEQSMQDDTFSADCPITQDGPPVLEGSRALTRRAFMGISGAAATALLLSGCGGGGGSVIDGSVREDEVWGTVVDKAGTINQAEVGSQSVLVATAQTPTSQVGLNGGFTTTVGADGVEIVAAQDAAGALRGAAVWLPSAGGRQAQSDPPIVIDAQSTAAALVFATPGVLSTQVEEATQRHSQIIALPSFPSLVEYLRANLASRPLLELVSEADLESRVETCVREWAAAYKPSRHRAIQLNHSRTDTQVQFNVDEAGTASPAVIRLENWGWRYVRLYRRDLIDGRENLVVSVQKDGRNEVGGATPTDWGKLFSSDVGEPTQWEDRPDLGPNSGLTSAEYWLVGPGQSSGSDSLPASIDPATKRLWGQTIIGYFVLPNISVAIKLGSIVLGKWLKVKDLKEMVPALYDAMEIGVDVGKVALAADRNGISSKEFRDAFREAVVNYNKFLVENEIFYKVAYARLAGAGVPATVLKALAVAQVALARALALGTLVFVAGNGWMIFDTWRNVPASRRISVGLTSNTGFEVS